MRTSFPPAVPTRAVALLAVMAAFSACGGGPTRPAEVPEDCTPQATLPPLAVGEAILLSGSAAALLCPSPPAEDGDYLLVVHQASGDPADSLRLRVRPRSLQWPGSEPSPAPGAAPVAAPTRALSSTEEDPPMDMAQHMALRERERRELGWRVIPGAPVSGTPVPGTPRRAPAPTPAVGSILELNAQSDSPCEDPLYRAGEVMAVSSRAIVVADTANPSGGFDAQDYARFAATFDTLVAPLAENAFGQPSNFAGDGRIVLFFTPEVNRLSPRGSNSVVLGFFFSRDLFPRERTDRFQACAHSNETEILYLLVPDPEGRINGNRRTRDFVTNRTVSTMVHEYQHLINAGRRLRIVQTSNFLEETWLNEGLSHIAEELLFFREAGLEARSNIGVDELHAAGAIDAMNRHQLANVQRLRRYLAAPATNSPYDTGALLATRGAAWHFLRYALDRKGGAAPDFLRPLVDGPGIGVSNLAAALGGEGVLHEWLADWSVALYADSRVPGVAERHRDRSWNHASIFRALDEQEGESDPRYPLEPMMLRIEGPFERKIMGGGSDYVRFGIAAGDTASVQLTLGGGFPPGSLRASLLRIR